MPTIDEETKRLIEQGVTRFVIEPTGSISPDVGSLERGPLSSPDHEFVPRISGSDCGGLEGGTIQHTDPPVDGENFRTVGVIAIA